MLKIIKVRYIVRLSRVGLFFMVCLVLCLEMHFALLSTVFIRNKGIAVTWENSMISQNIL